MRPSRNLLRVAAAMVLSLALLPLAQAQRAQTRPAPGGGTITSWKANGVSFQARTVKMFGKIIDWERRATGKSGVTTINGKAWGSTVKGTETTAPDGSKVQKLDVKGFDGLRTVITKTAPSGTVRTTINLPDGMVRKITTWSTGRKTMTDTRVFGKDGKLVEQTRTAR